MLIKHSDNGYVKQFKSNFNFVMQHNHLSVVIHGVLTVLVEASVTVYPPLDLRSKIVHDVRPGNDYMAPEDLAVEETFSQDDVQRLVADVYEDLQASDKAIEGIEVDNIKINSINDSYTLEPI